MMIKGKVLITGITGGIGSMIAKTLLETSEYAGQVEIVGITRNIEAARENLGEIIFDKVRWIQGDVADKATWDYIDELDYIIHCAATTVSREMIENPGKVYEDIVLGTEYALSLVKRAQVKGMVFLSSMEVYGVVEDINRPRLEHELGTIDESSPRSCYPLAKKKAERMCYEYATGYKLPVCVARLAQVFGKGVRKSDNRVYMQFARSAIEGRDIILKTAGLSRGNYCDIEDAIGAILLLLEKGNPGDVYNVVNEQNNMTIKEMADLVAEKIADGKIGVRIELEDAGKTGYAPDTYLFMSSEKMRSLGWKPKGDLEKMYKDVIEAIKDH